MAFFDKRGASSFPFMRMSHGRRCAATIGNRQVMADPGDKGEPGDMVLVWPKKRAPMVLRRLARCKPYGTFYFATAGEQVVAVPCNKVTVIHGVILQ